MKHGMQPIRYDGWDKIRRGITTCEEVLRVTMEDEFNNEFMLMNQVKQEMAEEKG